MNKNFASLITFFVFFALFFSPKEVSADQWIKYEQNPIISSGNGWENDVAGPTIIFDENKLKMWYQGYTNDRWNISYAESKDGITWQRNSASPVLIPQTENGITETNLVEPCVIKNDIYRMWFNSQNNGVYKIRYATSQDGINWTKNPGYVLTGESSWESTGVANPYVIYKDGKYIMWYMGWGSEPWQIGYAESTDGITWIKSNSNPLPLPNSGHVGGQSVIYKNSKFHMFYHTGDSMAKDIYYVISDDGLDWSCDGNCSILSASSDNFDSNFIVYPEVIDFNSNLYLYYTGHNGNLWQIGLATKDKIISKNKTPVIVIPGIFGSWNKQALVYNQTVNQSDWKMNPFVHEYDGIIQTLKNLGYEENKDYFVFNYDWRKSLEESASDLNIYINQIPNVSKDRINILGHSLGGLVGRIYTQKFGTDKINKLITVGSPHLGVAQVYKTVEAGEIDRFNDYFWLTSKFLLQIYRDGIKTDKQIISEKIPVIKDLFPTYNFLKNTNNQEISISNMSIKNDTLISYNLTLPNIYSVITSFVGEKGNTIFGFKVSQKTNLDKLLDFYPDGHPIENFNQIGDYTVISSSAKASNNNKIFELGHNELIYKKESIKEILTSLDIPYQEDKITEGQGTTITPSLLFLVLSPAEMKVIVNNNTYIEKDGFILIEDAPSGNYQLELTGKEKGKYQVLIGQVGENSDQWAKIDGEIKNDDPITQKDIYQIKFDQINPKEIDPNIDATIIRIIDTKAKKYLIEAKKAYLRKKYLQVKINLEKALQIVCRLKLIDSINDIEHLYSLYLQGSRLPIFDKKLKAEISLLKKTISFQEQFLLWQKRFGKNVIQKALILKLAKEKVSLAENKLKEKNFYYTEILLKSVEYLLKEIR